MTEIAGASVWFVAGSGLATILAAGFVLWLVSLRMRDASIVDPFWAPGFLLVAVAYLATWGQVTVRGGVAVALVATWAVRLGAYLLRRHGREGEDRRYRAMREAHGDAFGRVSLFTVFWLQGVILWVVSLPLLTAVVGEGGLAPWQAVGALVALAGIVVEGVADAQLRAFKAASSSAGRVLDTGLWRYSRHPNYFGNAVMWWGFFLLGVDAGTAWTVVSPVVMTFLLVRVSGVALLERDIGERRPEYARYVARTSAFVPWPPRAD